MRLLLLLVAIVGLGVAAATLQSGPCEQLDNYCEALSAGRISRATVKGALTCSWGPAFGERKDGSMSAAQCAAALEDMQAE